MNVSCSKTQLVPRRQQCACSQSDIFVNRVEGSNVCLFVVRIILNIQTHCMDKHAEVVLNLAVRIASKMAPVVNKYYCCRLKYFNAFLLSMNSEKRDEPVKTGCAP
jgi:hypothetical protein